MFVKKHLAPDPKNLTPESSLQVERAEILNIGGIWGIFTG
jgi:hypothetical protein